MKKLTLLMIILATLGLSACETMQGLGRDLEKAGESIQDAAE